MARTFVVVSYSFGLYLLEKPKAICLSCHGQVSFDTRAGDVTLTCSASIVQCHEEFLGHRTALPTAACATVNGHLSVCVAWNGRVKYVRVDVEERGTSDQTNELYVPSLTG